MRSSTAATEATVVEVDEGEFKEDNTISFAVRHPVQSSNFYGYKNGRLMRRLSCVQA
jgi:hypothetical protein